MMISQWLNIICAGLCVYRKSIIFVAEVNKERKSSFANNFLYFVYILIPPDTRTPINN
jgi:hypothetical protein